MVSSNEVLSVGDRVTIFLTSRISLQLALRIGPGTITTKQEPVLNLRGTALNLSLDNPGYLDCYLSTDITAHVFPLGIRVYKRRLDS